MSDRENKNKMTETDSIGQFTADKQATAQNQTRWTWTIGQFRADRHLYSTGTMRTHQEEKIKIPHFAFLKIFATTYCTHLQSHTSHPVTQALQKSAILPPH
ncbi:MAG: hypothetical protein HLUCCA01_13635 [Bacteroidetes bacterium HLUCCA01]|nr:MAG: hypothetical protein HLUCCA01_13635 [Bacteroidetes bacterium HLUCCA01]